VSSENQLGLKPGILSQLAQLWESWRALGSGVPAFKETAGQTAHEDIVQHRTSNLKNTGDRWEAE